MTGIDAKSDNGHTKRFGVVALIISGGELLARVIGADAGRDDPVLVLGLVALTAAAVMILRDDDRGRTAWILAGLVMTLYAIARILIVGRPLQTAALALLGIMLGIGAEHTLRPVESTTTRMRVARSVWFDLALIPLAVFALWPFGVSLDPQGALANAARDEGYPRPAHEVEEQMAEVEPGVWYYKLPNGCTVSTRQINRFWHPGPIYCGPQNAPGSDD